MRVQITEVMVDPLIVKVCHEATGDLRAIVRRLRAGGMTTPACRSLAQMLRIREQVGLDELVAIIFGAEYVLHDGLVCVPVTRSEPPEVGVPRRKNAWSKEIPCRIL